MSILSVKPIWSLFERGWCAFSHQVPSYHLLLEAVLLMVVGWLVVRRVQTRAKNKNKSDKLTKEEEEELLAEWKPQPLVPDFDPDHPALHVPVIREKPGKTIVIDGQECVNFATHNYLGFAGRKEVEEAAIKCVRRYGVGSCGPRAFYGTADVHVHLEEKLAEFFGAEQAVLYSYGFSTIASAIPAYAKKGDIIFVDECANFAIQKAMDASRSKIKYFKHNDCQHLETLLEQQAREDAKNPKQAKVSRRFLVVEGIYMNTGTLCDMKRMIQIKKLYKLRLMIDETVSFGTLGKTGRGITEHFGIPMVDVDLIMATLEHSMGSIGGFCVGSSYVVEHQTLAGLGYCFSASLPPMFAAGVLKTIEIMEADPVMFGELKEKNELVSKSFGNFPGLELIGDPLSPVKHLRLRKKTESRSKDKEIMRRIVEKAREKGIALVVASYLDQEEVNLPPMSIRITVSNLLTREDIENARGVITKVCEDILMNSRC